MGAERHVKFFRNGGNQALIIAAEFEIAGDEAVMRKEGDRLVIEPVKADDSRLEWLAALEPWVGDFPDINKPPPRDVDL